MASGGSDGDAKERRRMPLPGGAADKYGGRYEGLWTILCMADVMAERADSIYLEQPGEEGKGVEFRLLRSDVREYHQVKRQRGRGGNWTLAALNGEGVLTNFFEKLNDPGARCVFVSADSAPQLRGLAERAGDAGSWPVFDRDFLEAEGWRQRFGELRSLWGGPEPEEAFVRLRRIRASAIDEETLGSNVEARLEPLVEGDPSVVAALLMRFALDSVHRELSAYDIWAHLEEKGHGRRDWSNDPRVLANVEKQNAHYLDELREELVGGASIPRGEASEALDLLVGEGAGRTRGVMLAGEAGVGKSGAVSQTLEGLRERGVPFLAFRVDRLEPTTLPEGVGEQIGLPGSPAGVLAAVTRGRECVLVIDQLDAVSLVSGRNSRLFEVVRTVIRQAGNYPGMRLLMACRRIDLEIDRRLGALTRKDRVATVLDVGRLQEGTVREAVSGMGLDGRALGPGQVRLLSVPLHLRLLEEISGTSSGASLEFRTADDLYDEFWERKRLLVRDRLGVGNLRWTPIMDALCDRMSESQALSVPAHVLSDYEDEAKAMASEHVLVLDRGRYAFFHEGFFDYVFARRFAERELKLLPLLSRGEQHLFRRAQVRQILQRARDQDRERYLGDLRGLLHGQDVRFHIKQVVFALLAKIEDPSPEECGVLVPLLDGAGAAYEREVWGVLRSSGAWSRVADSLGLWERWLVEGGDERRERVVAALYTTQKEEPDRVAELLEPYFDPDDPAWARRFVYLFRGADFGAGRGMFDLFLRAIDGGLVDDAEFQLLVHDLAEKDPARCSEALARFLRRRLDLSLAAGNPNPFYDPSHGPGIGRWSRNHHDERVFMESARGAPREFAARLLPFVLTLAQGLMEEEGDAPWRDPVWQRRDHDEQTFTHEFLLAATVEALRALATDEPGALDPFAQLLRGSDAETAQYLLVRAYAANGERYADDAAGYLLERPARLETGYAVGPYHATRELLEAVTPHCSDDNLRRLEELIMGYHPRWEKSARGEKWRGEAQLTLLDAVDASRRSEEANSRVHELRARFGDRPVAPLPPSVRGGIVQSPIPQEEAAGMSDDEWLDAIAKYPTARLD